MNMKIQQVAFFITMKRKRKLTLKQKLFCKYYLETRGNATEAVIRAGYKVDGKDGKPDRTLAKSIGSENLTKPYLREHIDELLEAKGFNDESVKLEHLRLISQSDNLSVKARAIDIYYKVKGNYAPERFKLDQRITKVEVTKY